MHFFRIHRATLLDRIDSVGPGDPNGVGYTNTLNVGSSSAVAAESPSEVVKLPNPPPATKAKVPPPTMVSKGVINGQAKYLPHRLRIRYRQR